MVSSSVIQVTYTNASGVSTILSPSQYTLVINAPAPGAIWGIGGTITCLIGGLPIANSTSLTVARTVPLTQNTSISNQGAFSPQSIESALDALCFEIQQVSARGGAYRGVWSASASYNFGDIAQDGVNGAYTNNVYVYTAAGTPSGVWATDLAAGLWSLVLNVQTLSATAGYLPLSGGTISGNLTVSGTLTNSALALLAPKASPLFTGTAKLNGLPLIDKINVVVLTSPTGTYTPTSGTVFAVVEGVGGGGGSGGIAQTTGVGVSGAGGGGGYARKLLTAAQLGASQSYACGVAGAAAASGNNSGGNGGTSTFGAFMTCNGGVGGNGSATFTTAIQAGGSGGAGGSSSGGDVNVYGGGGSFGFPMGAVGEAMASSGGGTPFFISAFGHTATPTAYSGAGASCVPSSSGDQPGAAGAAGSWIVTEFISA